MKISEEMRVLYVAMTRPKNKLIMIGLADKLDNKLKKVGHRTYNFANGNTYLDWLCPLPHIPRGRSLGEARMGEENLLGSLPMGNLHKSSGYLQKSIKQLTEKF